MVFTSYFDISRGRKIWVENSFEIKYKISKVCLRQKIKRKKVLRLVGTEQYSPRKYTLSPSRKSKIRFEIGN